MHEQTDRRAPLTRATGRQKAAAMATVTVVGGAIVVNGAPVTAAEFQVTNLDAAGPGSLAQAVEDANSASGLDQIRFAAGLNGTIALSGPLEVDDDLAIIGPGGDAITLSNATGSILYVYDANSFAVSGLTLNGGDTAISTEGIANVTVTDVTITGVSRGIDLNLAGTVTVSGVTFDDVEGKGIDIDDAGAVTVTGSNFTAIEGDAVEISTVGDVTIADTTFSAVESDAIEIETASDVTLTGSSLDDVSNDGLDVDEVGDVSVTSTTFNDIGSRSIVVTDGGDVTVTDATIAEPGSYAVSIRDSGSVTVTGSMISGVRRDGLNVRRSDGDVSISDVDIAQGSNPYSYGGEIDLYNVAGAVSISRVDSVDGIRVRFEELAPGDALAGAGVPTENRDVSITDVTLGAGDRPFVGISLVRADGSTTVSDVTISSEGRTRLSISGSYAYGAAGPTGIASVDTVSLSSATGGANVQLASLAEVVMTGVDADGALEAFGVETAEISDSSFVNGREDSLRLGKDSDVSDLEVAADGFRRDGSAMRFGRSDVSLSQVTVVGHEAGTAVRLYDTDLTVRHSTIAGNTLSGPAVFATTYGRGDSAGSTLDLDHTIFNDVPAAGFDVIEAEVFDDDRLIMRAASDDQSVVAVTATHSVVADGVVVDYGLDDTNVAADDARLGPLQDNGGTMLTVAPLPGSPAVDAGDPAVVDAPPLDQRGEARIVDTIDIGAVETTTLFESIAPARFVDTRPTGSTVDDRYAGEGKRATGSTYIVDIAGRGEVPADATAVVMNVTAVAPEGGGFLTVFGCDDEQPVASSLNFNSSNVGNEIVAGLGDDGSVCLFIQGTAHLTVDVVAYATELSALTPVTPARAFESRIGRSTADGRFQGSGTLPAGSQATVTVAGRNGVPADAEVVIVNVTAIRPETAGFMTVHPCLPDVPNASSVNFAAGTVRANEVVAQLNEFGELCVFTSAATDLAIDVVAYLPAGAIEPVTPARLLDTRATGTTVDGQSQRAGQAAAGSTIELTVAGRAGVPTGVKAVVVNVTAIRPRTRGFVTASACVTPPPTASSLNYEAGVNTPNEIIVGVDDDGKICLFTSAATELAVDVVAFIR